MAQCFWNKGRPREASPGAEAIPLRRWSSKLANFSSAGASPDVSLATCSAMPGIPAWSIHTRTERSWSSRADALPEATAFNRTSAPVRLVARAAAIVTCRRSGAVGRIAASADRAASWLSLPKADTAASRNVSGAVIKTFGRPLAAPSANRFGRISPTTGAHVLSELGGRIPLILEAGPTAHGLESTVVLPAGDRLRILRHGPITAETLAAFARVETSETPADPARNAAPGQTPGHYAPRTPLVFAGAPRPPAAAGKAGLLAFCRDRLRDEAGYAAIECLSEDGDLRVAATRLFAALRRLDAAGLDLIVAEPVPEEGLGRAINERLRRAATGSGPG